MLKKRILIIAFVATTGFTCLPPGAGFYSSPTRSSNSVQYLKLCVKYETQYGWSHGYLVDAQVMKGNVLNYKTSTYNYNTFSTYVVIFWDQGEASIIELSYFFGSFTYIEIDGIDQEGIKWKVSATDYCY